MAERPRVLVCSASPTVIMDALRQDGRFVTLAVRTDAERAADEIFQAKPDIVILEVGNVDGPGPDLAERVARDAPYATLVILSPKAVFGAVQGFMHVGADGFLESPFDLRLLGEYVHSLHLRVSERKRYWTEQHLELTDPRHPRLVAVFSPKGGVGKTTVAINLAVALGVVTGHTPVLLDMDVEAGDAATILDLQPKRSLLDFANAHTTGEEVDLAPYLTRHSSGLQLLAAPPGPESADLIRADHVTRAIAMAKAVADFVVADTSPSFTEHVLAVLDRADQVFLLLTPDITALKNVRIALAILAELQYPAEKIAVIMNRCSRDIGLTASEVTKALGRPVVAELPEDAQAILSAVNEGKPFVLLSPQAPVTRVLLDLANQVVRESARAGGPAATVMPPESFFRRLLRFLR